jgi:hypothetical protein
MHVVLGWERAAKLAQHCTRDLFHAKVCYLQSLMVSSLTGWTERLENLHLASNSLEAITPPKGRTLNGIRRVNLASNEINLWSTLDALAAWCPKLENLNFAGNPLATEERYGRQLIIARVGSLEVLEGSKVSTLILIGWSNQGDPTSFSTIRSILARDKTLSYFTSHILPDPYQTNTREL